MLEDVRFNGWLPGREDPRDYHMEFRTDMSLPRRVDLRPGCTPVEDQRHIGSCVANAVVGAAEYLEGAMTGQSRPPDLSRLFVYFNARYMHGMQDRDSGTYVSAAMASLAFYGVCLERLWPYDPDRWAETPPNEAYADAQQRQGLEYARVNTGEDIKRALAAGLPVAFGTAIPEACYQVAATNGGRLPMPDQVPQDNIVGHAMLIVGYDLDQGHYIIRNSWGEGWGDRGYCYAPLALVDTYPQSQDFWTLRKMETPETNYRVVRPARSAARTCPHCGAAASETARFCPACGRALESGRSDGGMGRLLDEIDRRRDQAQRDIDRRLEEDRRRLQEDIDRLLGRDKDRK